MSELPPGPPPPFFTKKLFNLLSKASVDRKPDNSSFGDVLQQVYPVYRQVAEATPLHQHLTLNAHRDITDQGACPVFFRATSFLSRS